MLPKVAEDVAGGNIFRNAPQIRRFDHQSVEGGRIDKEEGIHYVLGGQTVGRVGDEISPHDSGECDLALRRGTTNGLTHHNDGVGAQHRLARGLIHRCHGKRLSRRR